MIARKAIPVPTFETSPATVQAKYWRWFLLSCWLILSATAWAQAPTDPTTEPTTETTDPNAATPEAAADGQEVTDPTTEPQTAEPETPFYASRNERDNQLLAQAKPEEVRWLETPSGQILALFRPTESRTTKGVLLILHAAETPPGWPPALENARRNLPQHGWVTMALALPAKTPAPIPERVLEVPATVEAAGATGTENAAPADQSAAEPEAAPIDPTNPATDPTTTPKSDDATETPTSEPEQGETPPPTRAEIMAERISAALAWLAQEDYASVMLLVDNSSVVDSLAYLQTVPDNPVTLLALANLQAQEELTTAELDGIFTGQNLPVMDIFFAPAQGQMTDQRKRHRASALRNDVVYQQLHILPPQQTTLDDSMSFWVERLRGFMEQQTEAKTKR
jgi:hypothetical protein